MTVGNPFLARRPLRGRTIVLPEFRQPEHLSTDGADAIPTTLDIREVFMTAFEDTLSGTELAPELWRENVAGRTHGHRLRRTESTGPVATAAPAGGAQPADGQLAGASEAAAGRGHSARHT